MKWLLQSWSVPCIPQRRHPKHECPGQEGAWRDSIRSTEGLPVLPSPYATTRVPGYVVEEGSECDSLRSSTRTPSDPQGSHTYDVPFPVRRPEYEEQYSQIKRVPLSTLQTSNVYQAPQYCDSEKLVSRWIGRPASEPLHFPALPGLSRQTGAGGGPLVPLPVQDDLLLLPSGTEQ
ncbi:uncharacterized protein CEXT_755381 [Caerostris extrusa]|uniref:Uncharacterized protein n=1 Tax=Caerostris extrusa TaxID=172846 RepID=A0AAV4PTJ9_CAEEX|nr:uncharacterized protein CEXT_755381 [Caerostris extrusa]